MGVNKAGVIGNPVKHSLSPVMHNAAYKHLGLDWSYEAIELDLNNVGSQIVALFENGYKGLNVTMPFKEIAYEVSVSHGPAARLGTVNTLRIAEDGNIHGYSTDGQGFVNSLSENDIDLKDKKVLVIGAGGASKSICDALDKVHANIFVTARKLEQAMELVNSIVSRRTQNQTETPSLIDIVEYSNRNSFVGECEIIVNATPVGMAISDKKNDESPIKSENITSDHVVVDTIYNPLETKLLEQAKDKGAKTFNGIGMLVHQGALAFEIMTGQKAPINVMRNAIENLIAERSS